jgi:hypothetical protein
VDVLCAVKLVDEIAVMTVEVDIEDETVIVRMRPV